MSYILDALKKSEQERMRGATPTLHAVHAESFQQSRLMVWHYLLISAALVAATIAMWQRPWQTDNARTTDAPKVSFLPAPPPRPEPQPLLPGTVPSQPVIVGYRETPVAVMPKPARPREKAPATEAAPVKEPKEKVVARVEPPAAATPPAPQEAAPPPKPPAAEPSARIPARQEIIEFSELPASVQRSLPKLAISGYINDPASPSGKMLGIGSQLLGEGDEVSPGLKVEKIAETTAIFAYKGYRFRVSLP